MTHNLLCEIRNTFSAYENLRDDKGRIPTDDDEATIREWAASYQEWNCRCDYEDGSRY